MGGKSRVSNIQGKVLHTYTLDYVRVEFIFCLKKKKNYNEP